MIYPSADKLNKIGSKYKLISMAATRSKQIKAGMKPLIETTSTNPLTIAFEEIAAGLITANIKDVEELSVDYAELTRSSAVYEIEESDNKAQNEDDDTVQQLDELVENKMNASVVEGTSKREIAERYKTEAADIDDIGQNDFDNLDTNPDSKDEF